jgi:monoamine oxidase
MAGLTAARALAEAGREVTVLEASPRIGGRIHTVRDGNEVVELGAEFVHGRPPELWTLIQEAGLETYELDGTDLCVEDGALKPCHEETQEPVSILDRLKNHTGPDLTFAAYLDHHPLPEDQRQSAIGFVEGFNAADHRVISVASLGLQQAAEEEIEGDRLFRIRQGYDRLPQFLAEKISAAGGRILTDTSVQRIEWARHHVRIDAHIDVRTGASRDTQARIFEAAQAIIALPLGVLQRQSVAFAPVPHPLREADRLRMGQVCRFTLIFTEAFWRGLQPGSLQNLSFLFSYASMPPVWWTPHPIPSNALTGWVGGPRSQALARLTPDELAAHACNELATIFSLSPEAIQSRLAACHTHDWQHDPLVSGAYSYIPAGALDACSKMTVPCEDTLFFAGEHTDTTAHWGTVHAAIRSGQRAARQVLER